MTNQSFKISHIELKAMMVSAGPPALDHLSLRPLREKSEDNAHFTAVCSPDLLLSVNTGGSYSFSPTTCEAVTWMTCGNRKYGSTSTDWPSRWRTGRGRSTVEVLMKEKKVWRSY